MKFPVKNFLQRYCGDTLGSHWSWISFLGVFSDVLEIIWRLNKDTVLILMGIPDWSPAFRYIISKVNCSYHNFSGLEQCHLKFP